MKEADIINRVTRLATELSQHGVRVGIGDDAAVLAPPPAGHDLVVCVDTLNVDVHFRANDPAEAIGHKALAVNLSDLAAMGAVPAWATLSLCLPSADGAWVDAFCAGFGALAAMHGVALVGGDTTRGPLSVSVTAAGFVPTGMALRRGTARPGEPIWISGTVGDAGAALAGLDDPWFQQRLQRPTPRLALGTALRGLATACIDLSDGVRQDLPRLLGKLGAVVEIDRLPLSEPLARIDDVALQRSCAIAAGDDYELCFTAPADANQRVLDAGGQAGLPVTLVGHVDDTGSIRYLDHRGHQLDPSDLPGFEHF